MQYLKDNYETEKRIEEGKYIIDNPSNNKKLKFTKSTGQNMKNNQKLIDKTRKLAGIKSFFTNPEEIGRRRLLNLWGYKNEKCLILVIIKK